MNWDVFIWKLVVRYISVDLFDVLDHKLKFQGMFDMRHLYLYHLCKRLNTSKNYDYMYRLFAKSMYNVKLKIIATFDT
jgi:hypothetical protein